MPTGAIVVPRPQPMQAPVQSSQPVIQQQPSTRITPAQYTSPGGPGSSPVEPWQNRVPVPVNPIAPRPTPTPVPMPYRPGPSGSPEQTISPRIIPPSPFDSSVPKPNPTGPVTYGGEYYGPNPNVPPSTPEVKFGDPIPNPDYNPWSWNNPINAPGYAPEKKWGGMDIPMPTFSGTKSDMRAQAEAWREEQAAIFYKTHPQSEGWVFAGPRVDEIMERSTIYNSPKYQQLTQEYQAQHYSQVGSSGTLRPIGNGQFRNLQTGEIFQESTVRPPEPKPSPIEQNMLSGPGALPNQQQPGGHPFEGIPIFDSIFHAGEEFGKILGRDNKPALQPATGGGIFNPSPITERVRTQIETMSPVAKPSPQVDIFGGIGKGIGDLERGVGDFFAPIMGRNEKNPYTGIPVLEQAYNFGDVIGGGDPSARGWAQGVVKGADDFFKNTPVLGGFHETGQLFGADTRYNTAIGELTRENEKISPRINEINRLEQSYRDKGLIKDGQFLGNEDQFREYIGKINAIQPDLERYNKKIAEVESLKSKRDDLQQRLFPNDQPNMGSYFTYPIFKASQDFGNWYDDSVGKPFQNYVRPLTDSPMGQMTEAVMNIRVPIGPMGVGPRDVFSVFGGPVGAALRWDNPIIPDTPKKLQTASTTLVKSPQKFFDFIGQGAIGGEYLVKHAPSVIPSVGMGLIMQAQGLHEGITQRPGEFFWENVGFMAMSEGLLGGAKTGLKHVNPFVLERVVIPRGFGSLKEPKWFGKFGEMVEKPNMNANVYTYLGLKNPLTRDTVPSSVLLGRGVFLDKVPGAKTRPVTSTFIDKIPVKEKYTRWFVGNPGKGPFDISFNLERGLSFTRERPLLESTRIKTTSGLQAQEGDIPWSRGTHTIMGEYIQKAAKPVARDLWKGGAEVGEMAFSKLWDPLQREPFGEIGNPAVSRATLTQIFESPLMESKNVVHGGSRSSRAFAGEGFRDVLTSDFDTYIKHAKMQEAYNLAKNIVEAKEGRGKSLSTFQKGKDLTEATFHISLTKEQEFINAHAIEGFPRFTKNPVRVENAFGGESYVMSPRQQMRAKIGGMLQGWSQEPGKNLKLMHNPKRVKDIVDVRYLTRAMAADLYQPVRYDIGGYFTRERTGMANIAESFSDKVLTYIDREVGKNKKLYAKAQELLGQSHVDLLKGINRTPSPPSLSQMGINAYSDISAFPKTQLKPIETLIGGRNKIDFRKFADQADTLQGPVRNIGDIKDLGTPVSPSDVLKVQKQLIAKGAPGELALFNTKLMALQETLEMKPAVMKSPYRVIGDVETVAPGMGKEFLDISKRIDPDAQFYGSFTQRMQTNYTPIPKDIDVGITIPIEKYTNTMAEVYSKYYGKDKVQVNFEPGKTGGIERGLIKVYKKSEWMEALDVHNVSNITEKMEFGVNPQKPYRVEGINVMPISEQMSRKVLSTLKVQESRKGLTTGVKPHRGKDMADVIGGFCVYAVPYLTPSL